MVERLARRRTHGSEHGARAWLHDQQLPLDPGWISCLAKSEPQFEVRRRGEITVEKHLPLLGGPAHIEDGSYALSFRYERKVAPGVICDGARD